MAEHIAVLLAAGASRRLGQPKALLRRDGETLLQRCLRLLQETGARQRLVVIGPALTEFAASIAPAPDLHWLVNPNPEQGRLSSLHCALDAFDGDAPVLHCVVDQPALQRCHLEAVLQAAGPERGAVTDYGLGCGPPALWPSAWLRALPRCGDRGLFLLQQRHTGRIQRVVAAELALDIDTPEQLHAAKSAGFIDP